MPTMPKRVHSIKEYNPRKEKTNWLKDQEDLKFYNTQAWRKLSITYKMPVSEGGDKWDTNNFQALCKSCNASKTAKQSKR